MKDFATSSNPRVQAQLDRLAALSLPEGRIGLDAIRALLDRLGNPQDRLPPVFHVAGTNGKGSVCAFLRAILEAEGLTVHATTSPHLVRYNERIRIAGELISDELLADLLEEVLDTGEGISISFFEATIAAAFLAFSRTSADACVLEVGLGGRFDATNVIEHPAVCGIASLGIDHERFLLAPEEGTPEHPLARMAFEKAGIAKRGVPLVTLAYPPEAARQLERSAEAAGAPLVMRGRDWQARTDERIEYRDDLGTLTLPLPALPGAHQADNAALAVAMLRHQDQVTVSSEAMAEGIRSARWSARLQLLGDGPLTAEAPGREVWLDGGHNPDAGEAIARFFEMSETHPAATNLTNARQVSLPSRMREGLGVGNAPRLHVILGMLANKDPQAITGPLTGRIETLQVVPVPGHDSHPPAAFGPDAATASDVAAALKALPDDGLPVLIAGSLYLAGDVLRENDEIPN